MKRLILIASLIAMAGAGCARRPAAEPVLKATAFGSAIVEVSGGKQIGGIGGVLDQPVVVQVNDAQGTAVAGAAVYFHGPAGVEFNPAGVLTDSSGQATTVVTLGSVAGRYEFTAATSDRAGKKTQLKLQEIALGYQETLGRQLSEKYCARCHDPESTPERVSNMENLTAKPHAFTDGDTLNKYNDNDLAGIISHGGPALGKAAEMPPYGDTLSKTDVQALAAYIRAISDPPYRSAGVVYAKSKD